MHDEQVEEQVRNCYFVRNNGKFLCKLTLFNSLLSSNMMSARACTSKHHSLTHKSTSTILSNHHQKRDEKQNFQRKQVSSTCSSFASCVLYLLCASHCFSFHFLRSVVKYTSNIIWVNVPKYNMHSPATTPIHITKQAKTHLCKHPKIWYKYIFHKFTIYFK